MDVILGRKNEFHATTDVGSAACLCPESLIVKTMSQRAAMAAVGGKWRLLPPRRSHQGRQRFKDTTVQGSELESLWHLELGLEGFGAFQTATHRAGLGLAGYRL